MSANMKCTCMHFSTTVHAPLLPNPQDNFTFSDQYETPEGVYDAILDVQENHIVTHENDRAWRDAVVLNRPSLLALRSVISMHCSLTVLPFVSCVIVYLAFVFRYQRSEDSYLHPYKIIRLTSKFIKFRVVKVTPFYCYSTIFSLLHARASNFFSMGCCTWHLMGTSVK